MLLQIFFFLMHIIYFLWIIADNFKCPKIFGSFPHPTDCSKYYNCIVYVASMQTCFKGQLFHAEKLTCRPEGEVVCGNRQRPGKWLVYYYMQIVKYQ